MQQKDSIQPPAIPLNPGPPVLNETEPQIQVGGALDPKKEGWRSIISTILILIAAPLVALVLIGYVFQSYEVDGPSMETTLYNHDRLIVDKIPRTLARLTGHAYIPKRGDIIIFVKRGLFEFGSADNKQLIKRVIGLPGERVVVTNGVLTVYNNQHPKGFQPDLDPRYSSMIKTTPGSVDLTVGKDEVFVCGDNRTNSLDSRYFGTIPVGNIVGKLAFRIFPINKAESF
ncbi:signal peptidase I [Candidatus Saccharibacteria bacterium]|nr:signal peptidase I [Candidatus Saccharibacteria bacterium]